MTGSQVGPVRGGCRRQKQIWNAVHYIGRVKHRKYWSEGRRGKGGAGMAQEPQDSKLPVLVLSSQFLFHGF